MNIKFYLSISILSIVLGCKPKYPVGSVTSGEADFSRIVAVSGSNGAGYSDDALSYSGQKNAFTTLLVQQLELSGSVNFNQAFLAENSVGVNLNGQSVFDLNFRTDCLGATSLGPVRRASSGDASVLTEILGIRSNMSVPFMRCIDAVDPNFGNSSLGSGNYNPFYTRIASNPSVSTVKGDATNQLPTFSIISLGEEDVLRYAQSGGTKNYTPVSGSSGIGFQTSLEEIVNDLTSSGAKGVIQNVPDVLSMPYFTTIPWDNLVLSADQAAQLNVFVQPLGITMSEGRNGFIIEDASAPSGYRKMVAGEYVLLSTPLDSVKCFGYGSQNPFKDRHVLTLNEVNQIQSITADYNQVIATIANQKGLAVADAKSLYDRVKTGFTLNGVSISSKFVQGNFFSLDGRYLCPMGQALLANEYIKAINSKYNSSIPLLVPTNYSGVKFP